MTGLIIVYAIGLMFLLHPIIESLLIKKKRNKQINVYIDETNKMALVAPQKKASAEDIEEIQDRLEYTYDKVVMVAPKVKIKGAYRK